jgi:hypothetical protein
MPNATCIYLYEGELAPIVFDTTVTERERRGLDRWFAENPDLDSLVHQAIALAEREAERADASILRELAEQHRWDAAARGVAQDELRAVLARVVAAQEELTIGAGVEVAQILRDLEANLAELIERAA